MKIENLDLIPDLGYRSKTVISQIADTLESITVLAIIQIRKDDNPMI